MQPRVERGVRDERHPRYAPFLEATLQGSHFHLQAADPTNRAHPYDSLVHRTPTIARRAFALITRLLLAFFLGAIVSIAIAIVGASTDLGAPRRQTRPAVRDYPDIWDIAVREYRLVTVAIMYTQPFAAHTRDPQRLLAALDNPPLDWLPDADSREAAAQRLSRHSPVLFYEIRSAGWPLRSLAWQSPPPQRSSASSDIVSWPAGSLPHSIQIPAIPLWRNLAVNSAILGSPLFLLLLAASPLRARVRRHRDLCPCCAYDLQTNLTAGCPECGWKRDKKLEPPAAP